MHNAEVLVGIISSKRLLAGAVILLLSLALAGGAWASAQGGTVWAWGGNFHGELGDGTTSNSAIPKPVSGLTGVTSVAGGYYHTAALKSDGTVWTWGYNGLGQLGDGSTTERHTPVQVK